jgi:hypothetical protein
VGEPVKKRVDYSPPPYVGMVQAEWFLVVSFFDRPLNRSDVALARESWCSWTSWKLSRDPFPDRCWDVSQLSRKSDGAHQTFHQISPLTKFPPIDHI